MVVEPEINIDIYAADVSNRTVSMHYFGEFSVPG